MGSRLDSFRNAYLEDVYTKFDLSLKAAAAQSESDQAYRSAISKIYSDLSDEKRSLETQLSRLRSGEISAKNIALREAAKQKTAATKELWQRERFNVGEQNKAYRTAVMAGRRDLADEIKMLQAREQATSQVLRESTYRVTRERFFNIASQNDFNPQSVKQAFEELDKQRSGNMPGGATLKLTDAQYGLMIDQLAGDLMQMAPSNREMDMYDAIANSLSREQMSASDEANSIFPITERAMAAVDEPTGVPGIETVGSPSSIDSRIPTADISGEEARLQSRLADLDLELAGARSKLMERPDQTDLIRRAQDIYQNRFGGTPRRRRNTEPEDIDSFVAMIKKAGGLEEFRRKMAAMQALLAGEVPEGGPLSITPQTILPVQQPSWLTESQPDQPSNVEMPPEDYESLFRDQARFTQDEPNFGSLLQEIMGMPQGAAPRFEQAMSGAKPEPQQAQPDRTREMIEEGIKQLESSGIDFGDFSTGDLPSREKEGSAPLPEGSTRQPKPRKINIPEQRKLRIVSKAQSLASKPKKLDRLISNDPLGKAASDLMEHINAGNKGMAEVSEQLSKTYEGDDLERVKLFMTAIKFRELNEKA